VKLQCINMENSTVSWSATCRDVVNSSSNCSDVSPTVHVASSPQLATRYVVVVLYLVTTVFGMCGNSLTIFVLLRHHRVRTVATCFILNLAIADDLFLVSLPFIAYSTYVRGWVFGSLACRLMNTFWGVNLYASIFTMTLMSVDRYLAVVHPLKSIRYRTCRHAFIVCAVIWTLAFLFVLPLPLYSEVHEHHCLVGNSLSFAFLLPHIIIIIFIIIMAGILTWPK